MWMFDRFFNIVCLNTDIMKLAGSLAQVGGRATSGATRPRRGITVPPSLRSSRRQEQRTATLATVFVTRCPPATTSVSTRWPLVWWGLGGTIAKIAKCCINKLKKTLPKAQRTRGLSSSCQSNYLRLYHKFKRKSWSHFIFRISTKNQLKISTKHQHLHSKPKIQNLDQA